MPVIRKDLLQRLHITVSHDERVVIFKDGCVNNLLRPGRHIIKGFGSAMRTENYILETRNVPTSLVDMLNRDAPGLATEHLQTIAADPDNVTLIMQRGQIVDFLLPNQRLTLWREMGPWETEVVPVGDLLQVDPALYWRLPRIKAFAETHHHTVPAGHIGLLYIDQVLKGPLEPGQYMFWITGQDVTVKMVDLRQQSLDVGGQEILTRDRVSIRVNITATWQVMDAVEAVTAVKDHKQALYEALQHAFRASLGTKTLDKILADKVSVDAEAAALVREQMAAIGLKVGDIAIKDVILPGDMRDILNKVVAAEKEAEANVIRRREETNATRSLLNTAKVMQDNPAILRLKELEALEKISGNIQNLTVHSGTQGLLDDIVTLRTG